MPDIFGLTTPRFETFFLVLVRCSVLLTLLPVFSSKQFPMLPRFGLGLLISFVVWRTLPEGPALGLGALVVAVLAQAMIALVLGFVASLVFMGVQFAGEILDVQIGFGVVNVINPATNQQVTIVGQFQLAIATLLFLISDGHHLMLEGLRGSFDLVPLPYVTLGPTVATAVATFFTSALFIVFKIGAPAAVALFATNVALGLLARVAPQMNVFVVGFPLQIAVGLIMLVVTIPLMGAVMPGIFDDMPRQLDTTLRTMAAPR